MLHFLHSPCIFHHFPWPHSPPLGRVRDHFTLGLSSSDHWEKTLGAIAPFFRGHAHALANGYGQPWMRLASKVMPGRRSPITRAEHLAIPCSECSANPTHSLEALQWPPISPPSRGGSVPATYLKCCHCLLHGKRTSKEQQAGQCSMHASEDEAPVLLLQLMLCTLSLLVAHGSPVPSAAVTCLL